MRRSRQRPSISVAMNTYDEASNIEIARAFGAHVIEREHLGMAGPLRHTFVGVDDDRNARCFRRHTLETTPGIHAYVRPLPGSRTTILPRRTGRALYRSEAERWIAGYDDVEEDDLHGTSTTGGERPTT